jgi:hypothetical protein
MFGRGKPLLFPLGHQFFLILFYRAHYPVSAGILVPPVFEHGTRGAFSTKCSIADGGAVVPRFGICAFCNLLQLQSPTHGALSHAQGGPQGCCLVPGCARTRRGQNANCGPGGTTPTGFFLPWRLPLFQCQGPSNVHCTNALCLPW